MTRNFKNIIDYSEGDLTKREQANFEADLEANVELREEFITLRRINEYMRARFDLEAAIKDPELPNLDIEVNGMLSDYNQNPERYLELQDFVKDSLGCEATGKEYFDEISQIKKEISDHNLNELSENWVKEWNEKNRINKTSDDKKDTIRNYITGSLESEDHVQEPKTAYLRKRRFIKTNVMSIVGLSVAATIALIFVISTLIPSRNIDKLYSSYYKPMIAFSQVSRSANSNLSASYTEAIEMYKKGDYKSAAAGFSIVSQSDPLFIAPQLFEGVSQMELGNYSQAVLLLSGVIEHSQEYVKEAQWYLGLSYLKTGECSKAIACFEILAGTEGFYHDRAKKILRRLK